MNKEKIINKLLADHKNISDAWDALAKVVGMDYESALGRATWFAFDNYVSAVSAAVGDDGDWISWFIHENDCGQRAMQAGYDGKLKKVKTVKDLVKLIEEGVKRK